MAEENLVTNIVAKSNFSDLIGDLSRVSSKLVSLQQTLNATNKSLAVQAAQMQKSFSDTMRSTGQFSTHFTSVQNDVEKFGRGLDSGRLKLGQYYGAWREHSRTAGGLIRDLARQQVQLQNSVLQPLGKNAQGIMQYAVHVPRGLDAVRDKSALASQELKIMNRVIQDGANGLINWGKNTQWAGRQLSVGLTLPIALFGKTAATAFREADEQLVRLTKVYGGVAATSAVELAKVRKEVSATARELSAAYGASYKDTIGLAADIAATGKQGEELLNSTRQATRLSILGEVDRQEAMKATLSIQTAFKQNTQELAETINFLNAVENQTSTSLADLVEAIPKAGPVVKALGGDVQDLALYLTAMREGGINASEGANALKSALASIINPTKIAKEMFMGFGIDLGGIVTKNAGNLTGTILEIQKALDSLDPLNKAQAIEQLFGKFQFARMNALFENLGKQGSQTLQVLDLMKTSSADLANIAGRELAQITESASGKYRRALETLKADLAVVGEQFLNIGTKIINVLDGIIRFFGKLPDPIKKILTFVAGLTAIAGPIIMLTGLFANFFGYIAKGLFHLRALIKGGEGFKLLTPEIVAAQKAGQLMEGQFYDDAKAAAILKQAISNLTNELRLLEVKANSARVAVGPAVSTMAGSVIATGQGRVADPSHPLIGRPYTRAFAHLNPVAGMTQEERLGQTIFGVAPNPQPLNQRISNNPQMYMDSDLPRVDRVSSARGFSTGIVAGEAAKWHAMTAALAMQSKEEIALLKSEVAATGAVTTSLSTSYQALLPEMTRITSLAAQEGALIVRQLEAGKLTVDQARAKIILLNRQIEAMMAQSAQMIATQHGRTLALGTVPLTRQPVVDPLTGKSNMRELFHKGPTASLVDTIARNLGVRTSGGGYSIETTMPRVTVAPFLKRNKGGDIETFGPNKTTVSGPSSITYDDRLGSVPLGGYVLNQKASLANPELAAYAPMTYNKGGNIVAELTPQETVFGPGIRAIPGLYQAVDAANRGQSVGGTITPGRKNYGVKLTSKGRFLVDQETIGKLWRAVKTKFTHLEPKGTHGFFGGSVVTKIGERLNTNKLNTTLAGEGIAPNILLASVMSRGGGARLSTDVFLRALRDAGIVSKSEERRLSRLIFTKYASTIKGMPLVNDKNNPIYSVSDSVIRQELINLKNGDKVEKFWTQFSKEPGMFSNPSRRSPSGFLKSLSVGNESIPIAPLEGNKAMDRKFFHASSADTPLHVQLSKMHAEQPFIDKPHGLPASRLAELTSRWAPHLQYYRPGYQYDRGNTDPLHGPLFIGRPQAHDLSGPLSLNKNVWYSELQGGKPMLTGRSPMFPSTLGDDAAMYATRQYVEGNKAVMAWMAEQKKLGLSGHPLSISSLMRSLSTPFSGRLFRGIRKNTYDSLPKEVQDAISIARATGDTKSLIGLEFIMRRSSFSKDPAVAKDFAMGDDALMLEAVLAGRKVTDVSKLFPDAKFPVPFGQGGGASRSEEEAIVGGKFKIIGFKDGKLTVEAVDGRAIGGSVSGGTPYVVGERGPEIFVPQSSGKILPNDMYAAGGDIIAGRSAYGVSGNPAVRAQQEAERKARAAAYNTTPSPQPEAKPGPLTGSRTTIIGQGGVRTNVYGVQGSLPYMPALGLPFAKLNMAINSSLASMSAGLKIASDKFIVATKAIGGKIVASAQFMSNQIASGINAAGSAIKSAANSMTSSIQSSMTSLKTRISAMAHMANPGYGAGFGQNFKYGTSLMMMPFGRGGGPRIDPATGQPRVSGIGGGMVGGMATWMGGGMAGGAVGKKVGGETGAMVGSIAAPLAIMGVLKLVNSFRTLRFAGLGAGVALKTALGVLGRFIPIIGPLLAIGQALNMWRRHSEDIGKANRAVFGPTEKSLKEVGLKYVSLNTRLKEYREQIELTRAAGLAALNKDGKTSIGALTLTVKELDKGIKDAKKNSTESVQNFNKTYGKQDVLQLAASLKQQYVSAGMSIQEATNQIYILMKASNKGSLALEAISSKAFKSITDQATAADYALNLVSKTLTSGNFNAEEMSVGVQNIINSLDQYRSSLLGTTVDGDIISEAEALKLTLDKIANSKAGMVVLDKETIKNLKQQNLELNFVLRTNETLASTYAKIALLQSPMGQELDLYGMDPKKAIAVARGAQIYSEAIEETIDKDLNLDKTITSFEKMAKAATKAAGGISSVKYDNIIKQQNAIIKQLDKELQLRLKNLDAQQKAADFATNLKKEQLNYQKALMTGDMIAAAEAKLNIQQLEKENEIMLAKQAIQDAIDKKKAIAEKKIEEANKQKDLLGEAATAAQNSAINANTSATAFSTFNAILNRLVGSIAPNESLDETEKTILRTGLKDALDALKQSGGTGAQFVKNFAEKNMGKDQGISYLQGLANDSGDLAQSDKFAGKFATAVDLFFTAVQEFSGGKAYVGPTKKETRDINFGVDKVAMIFEGKGKSYGVITNQKDSGKTYLTWVEAGYKFRGYDEHYVKKGFVDPKMEQTTDRRPGGPPPLAMGGAVPKYADGGSYAPGVGGYIRGRGTPTSDSILLPTGNGGLIRASDTEFMQPASSVSYYGTGFMEDIRARRIPREIVSAAMGGAIPGYANAGAVKPNPSAANIRKYMSLRDSINDPRTHITRSVKGDNVRRMVAENVASKYYEPGSKQYDSAVYMYENNNWAAKGYDEYWSAYQSEVNSQVLDRSKTLSRMKSHMGIKDGDYTGISGFLAGLGLPVRAMGGAIPGYHKGGPVGHKHYNPALASSNTTRPYGPYVPTLPTSKFNIPVSASSTASMFSPATGIAADPRFIADKEESNNFWTALGAYGNILLTPFTPSAAPDANKQSGYSQRLREAYEKTIRIMHNVYAPSHVGTFLMKPTMDAMVNIGAGDSKWNDYTTIGSNFLGYGLLKAAGTAAISGIKSTFAGAKAATTGAKAATTKVPKIPGGIATKSISALTPEAKAFAMADIDAQAIAAIKSADLSMLSVADEGFSFVPSRANYGLEVLKSGDPERIAISPDVIWELVQSQREAFLRAKYPKLDLSDVKTFNGVYAQEFYGMGKDDIIRIFKGGYGESHNASWRTGPDQMGTYFSTNPYVAAEYARFKSRVPTGQELPMFSMDVPVSQLTRPFGEGASIAGAQGSLEFPQMMYGPDLAAQTPKPYNLPSQVYGLMSHPGNPTSGGRYWPYQDGLFGGNAAQFAVPEAAHPITEKFGLSSILSRLLKPSEMGYGSELWTKKQIQDIMELAGKSGGLNDPTMGGAAIKRTPPWKEVNFAGMYSGLKHQITLPWRTQSDTVVHEGMHALDTTKYHWSYDDLFKYLHSVGRSDEANNLFGFYQRHTTPEDSPGALYSGIEGRLRSSDFSLYARFRGFMEGNAEDRTHVVGKKLLEQGDEEGALRIGTPYAKGQSYYNTLASLLQGSMDKGYEFYRHPSFIEGLLAVSHNMPKHTREKWEIWKEWLVSYGIDGSRSIDDITATAKLLQEALANGWAMGGSIPKFHNGGQVNTKFAGGETMALLKDKEMVFTQDQMTALGSIASVPNQSVPTSITYAPVINAAPGMDENMLANLVMVKLGTATDIRYKANGSSGMRVIK